MTAESSDDSSTPAEARGWERHHHDGLDLAVRRAGAPEGQSPLVVFLPDVAAPPVTEDADLGRILDEHQVTAVCPMFDGWWIDCPWPDFPAGLTPVEYLQSRLVPWITAQFHVAPPHIGLVGAGSGGQGVLQLAYRRAREFPVVAAISPAVDFHRLHGGGTPLDELFSTPEAARQQTVTLWLHPLSWPRHQLLLCDRQSPWFEGVDRLIMKLSSSGILFDDLLHDEAAGDPAADLRHSLPLALRFAIERLEQESRRI